MTQFPLGDTVHYQPNKWRAIGRGQLHFVDRARGGIGFKFKSTDALSGRLFTGNGCPPDTGAYIPGGDLGVGGPGRGADGDHGPAQREMGWG